MIARREWYGQRGGYHLEVLQFCVFVTWQTYELTFAELEGITKIGGGICGEVYRCKHKESDITMAAKVGSQPLLPIHYRSFVFFSLVEDGMGG